MGLIGRLVSSILKILISVCQGERRLRTWAESMETTAFEPAAATSFEGAILIGLSESINSKKDLN